MSKLAREAKDRPRPQVSDDEAWAACGDHCKRCPQWDYHDTYGQVQSMCRWRAEIKAERARTLLRK